VGLVFLESRAKASLLSVDAFSQIRQYFGTSRPLSALIEHSTIEQRGRVEVREADRDSLVLIREGGNSHPLFLVHDGDGDTMLYRDLAMHLKPDRAVYGLRPYSRADAPMAHTRIAEMAAYHIGKMRSVQGHGPYLVGGLCAGGVIAFEIARQLQNMGEKVALVALLDGADVKAKLKTWRMASQRARRFASDMRQVQTSQFHRRALMLLNKGLRKAKNLSSYLVKHQVATLREAVRVRLLRSYLDRGKSVPRPLQHVSVRTVYLFAERDYQPAGLFDGELVLFRATSGEGADEPYIARYEDPLFGWGERVTKGVRVYDNPGGHSSMLQEPHVRIAAEQLQASLDRALADLPPVTHR
jgi:thioesterase domain-containing protein